MRFITLKTGQNYTVNVLLLLLPHICTYFHFKLCRFVDRGRKNISCPKVQGTLATPLSSLFVSLGKAS